MATPNEKLAASLEALRKIQKDKSNIIRSNDLSRTHRERLQKTGFLKDVISGWLVITRPDDRPSDSTYWYASFWDFCLRYCNKKFNGNWCLSPEHSLLLQAETSSVPTQVVVWSSTASGNNRPLPFNTFIYDLKKELPPEEDLERKDGIPVLTIEAALIKATEAFYKNNPLEAQIVLGLLRSTTPLLSKLLDGGHVKAAGRIAGALRKMGRDTEADQIIKRMQSADYDVRELNPFDDTIALPQIQQGVSPLVGRIQNAWAGQRNAIIDALHEENALPKDQDAYLEAIDEIYLNDAYNSLSIEGYKVTEELIEKVRKGQFNPKDNPNDKIDKDALAARGYWQSFQSVRSSITRIINGEKAAIVAKQDHDEWYTQLFQPSVDAGILRAGVLAGFRNQPVFLRGSRHTPPRVEAVADGMQELFIQLETETSAAVRAVFSHWLMGYIHPYPDGNGRMARFFMNAMLASGGHPWTIIRLEDRTRYMQTLEIASTQFNIRPFANLIAERLEWSKSELKQSK